VFHTVETMIPQDLINDLTEIDRPHEIVDDGQRIFIVFKDYLLPPGLYNLEKTDLMIFTTPIYPNAGFDMFWVDQALTLRNGSIPKNGEAMEDYIGKKWRRFSYHPFQVKPWDPSNDSVVTYLSYVDQRLRKGD
jgi:hypothetical protein